MTDIAKLGFSVDSSEVDKGAEALNRVGAAGQKAASGQSKANSEFNKTAPAARASAKGVAALATAEVRASSLTDKFSSAISRLSARMRAIKPAATAAREDMTKLGLAANDNLNRLQATPGNIAAQFQDIGVTAAAGMNPMLIALQQGTQLSSAMTGGLKNVVAGFAQLFNATTVLTIGLVAVVAAGLQMVDWAQVGSTALMTFADVLEATAPYAVALAAALVLIYTPAILAGLKTLIGSFVTLTASMLAAVGIPTLIAVGLLAVVAAAIYFRNELADILGVDIVGVAKDGINNIIRFFHTAYNAITDDFRNIPLVVASAMTSVFNGLLSSFETLINGIRSGYNSLVSSLGLDDMMMTAEFKVGRVENNAAARLSRYDPGDIDYVGDAIGGINSITGGIADMARDYAKSLTDVQAEAGAGISTGGSASSRAAPKELTDEDKFGEIIARAAQQQRALRDAGVQIGIYGKQLVELQTQQQMLNAAQDAGIALTPEMTSQIDRLSQSIARLTQDNQLAQFREDLFLDTDDVLFALEREAQGMRLAGVEAEAWANTTDLLIDARRQNLDLGPEEIAMIEASALATARASEANRMLNQDIRDARTVSNSFWSDFIGGAVRGQNIFTSFANAVISSLNRIFDRLLSRASNSLFDSLLGTVIGSIAGGIGGAPVSVSQGALDMGFPDLTGSPSNIPLPGLAKGGVLDGSTMFMHNKGVGVAGEAGPEAVLPLSRGPNGILGVQAMGENGSSGPNSYNFTVDARGANDPEMVRKQVEEGLVEAFPYVVAAAEGRTIQGLTRPSLPGGVRG